MSSTTFHGFFSLLILVVSAVIVSSCTKHEKMMWAPEPETPERIPCEACAPFAGYYQLQDVVADKVNDPVVRKHLPAGTTDGEIFSGYLILNTFSELVIYQSGQAYNSQSFTLQPYSYTDFHNYWILNDSVITIGLELEEACFFPHLDQLAGTVDTIIWDGCLYVRLP